MAVSGGAGSKHNTLVGRGGRRRGNRCRSKRPFPKTMPIQTCILQSVMEVAWAFQLKFSQGVVKWDVQVDKPRRLPILYCELSLLCFSVSSKLLVVNSILLVVTPVPVFPFLLSAVRSAVLLNANSICLMSIPYSPLQILYCRLSIPDCLLSIRYCLLSISTIFPVVNPTVCCPLSIRYCLVSLLYHISRCRFYMASCQFNSVWCEYCTMFSLCPFDIARCQFDIAFCPYCTVPYFPLSVLDSLLSIRSRCLSIPEVLLSTLFPGLRSEEAKYSTTGFEARSHLKEQENGFEARNHLKERREATWRSTRTCQPDCQH